MALSIFGKIIFIAFIFFLAEMIKQGPFIFQSGKKYFINILDLEFDRKNLDIKTGDTVVWTNYDLIRHSVINNFPDIPNSNMLFPFDKYEHTFNKPGVVQFKSSLYDNMRDMTVNVEQLIKRDSYYKELFSNLFNFMKEFYKTIWLYIVHYFKKAFVYK